MFARIKKVYPRVTASVRLFVFSRGHTSFVNAAVFLNEQIVTASSDGTVRFWDSVTGECTSTVYPTTGLQQTVSARPVHSLMKYTHLGTDRLVAVLRGPVAYILDTSGNVINTMSHGKTKDADFIAALVSPQGKRRRFIFCQ